MEIGSEMCVSIDGTLYKCRVLSVDGETAVVSDVDGTELTVQTADLTDLRPGCGRPFPRSA
jgi:hypothetical protein